MGFSDDWFESGLGTSPVLAILRGLGPDPTLVLAQQLWDAGVTSLEIPVQRPADLSVLRSVAEVARTRGLEVGAGTIIDPDQVPLVQRAGAAFAVSPGFDVDVVRTCLEVGLPVLPGVATATEVQWCYRWDLHWCKAFPAAQLGPAWFTAMLAPYPMMRFVATGGVTVGTAGSFLAAGAKVISLGSALADPAQAATVAGLLG